MNRPNHPPCTKARHAFSLIEVIVAVVLLGIAMPLLLRALGDANTKQADYLLASRACWLASEKLEDILADRHSTTRGFKHLKTINYPTETSITGFPGYQRTVNFTPTGPSLSSAGTGYMIVAVTVTWTNVDGLTRSFLLSTAVTDY